MPPNILLFSTDDHGFWALHANGNSEIHSPILDTLALQGTRFTNAFTPSPVCSPARACLQTGRTPSQVGIHDWLEENDPAIGARDWLKDEITLPELLTAAGYHCGLAGKWHLGLTHQTPRGFAWCFGLPGHQGGHIGPYTYHLNGTPLTLTGNKTEIITTHALDFLAQSPTTHPFFLNVSYISTHNLPQYATIQSQLSTQLETFYAAHSDPTHSGLLVKSLPRHNLHSEAWRDHLRESHGLQIY